MAETRPSPPDFATLFATAEAHAEARLVAGLLNGGPLPFPLYSVAP